MKKKADKKRKRTREENEMVVKAANELIAQLREDRKNLPNGI